jgi:hypothetical protein
MTTAASHPVPEKRHYIRQAREAGHSWDQIGQALGAAPNADPDQAPG